MIMMKLEKHHKTNNISFRKILRILLKLWKSIKPKRRSSKTTLNSLKQKNYIRTWCKITKQVNLKNWMS